jgi:hypothetical protein
MKKSSEGLDSTNESDDRALVRAGTAGSVGWQSLGEQSRLKGCFSPRRLLGNLSAQVRWLSLRAPPRRMRAGATQAMRDIVEELRRRRRCGAARARITRHDRTAHIDQDRTFTNGRCDRLVVVAAFRGSDQGRTQIPLPQGVTLTRFGTLPRGFHDDLRDGRAESYGSKYFANSLPGPLEGAHSPLRETVICLPEANVYVRRTVICLLEANAHLSRTVNCLREATIRLSRTVNCLREAKIRLLRTVNCLPEARFAF